MQRQSLGSPATKRHQNGDADKSRRKSYRSGVADGIENGHDRIWNKTFRIRTCSYASVTERSIHLIPLLVLLCFLVLYLFSHDPSPKELSGFLAFEGRFDSEVAASGRQLVGNNGSGGRISALKTNRRLKQQFDGAGLR